MIVDILLTIVTMAFALMVVFSKKTVVAALSLLVTMLLIAVIYFQLGAIFLAAVQVLINAGAIAILFVFVMMLINLEQFQNNREVNKPKIAITFISSITVFLIIAKIITNNIETLTVNNIADNSMYLVFDRLFSTYYLPFEIASVLMLAAMVSCVVITGANKKITEDKGSVDE